MLGRFIWFTKQKQKRLHVCYWLFGRRKQRTTRLVVCWRSGVIHIFDCGGGGGGVGGGAAQLDWQPAR